MARGAGYESGHPRETTKTRLVVDMRRSGVYSFRSASFSREVRMPEGILDLSAANWSCPLPPTSLSMDVRTSTPKGHRLREPCVACEDFQQPSWPLCVSPLASPPCGGPASQLSLFPSPASLARPMRAPGRAAGSQLSGAPFLGHFVYGFPKQIWHTCTRLLRHTPVHLTVPYP